MAASQYTGEMFLSDDAEFRIWSQKVHTELVAAGLVNTSDTGQVDLTTAARPSANTYAGYKIYRLNDSLQSTRPIFIKIEYGTVFAQDRPGMRIQVANGTNGAGTLTGQIGTQKVIAPGGSKTDETTGTNYVCGDGSFLVCHLNVDVTSSSFGFGFHIERSHDEDGTDNNAFTYFATWGQNSGGPIGWQPIPNSGTIPSMLTAMPCNIPNRDQTFGSGADLYLLPVRPTLDKEYPPLKNMMVYRHADIAENAVITVNHYDADHVFMPLGDGGPPSTFTGPQGQNTVCACAMMFE